MSTLLDISNLSFAYAADGGGSVSVFSNFSLKVEQGTIIRLVGPNGSGKSTLLDLIAGRLEPTSGAILVCGTPPRSTPTTIAYLRQKPIENVAPNLTVTENLAFTADLRTSLVHWIRHNSRNISQVEKQLQEYDFSISDLRASQSAGALSGGQIQWLGLAMALLTEPSLLLLDEPTASLDQTRTARLLAAVAKYCMTTKATVIYVCHDSTVNDDSIPDICNRHIEINVQKTN